MYLSTGVVEGENPLLDYSPVTQQNLVRTDSFPNAPDILVMSTYWKDTDEVAAFEDQVASHGGSRGRAIETLYSLSQRISAGNRQNCRG